MLAEIVKKVFCYFDLNSQVKFMSVIILLVAEQE